MGAADSPNASDEALDPGQGAAGAEAFAGRLFSAAVAAFEVTAMDLGLRLGLYESLRRRALDPAELAAHAGVEQRYAREWLEQQAVAGVVECEDVGAEAELRRYRLPEAHARCLLDAEDPLYMAPFVAFARLFSDPLPELAEAYRTGAGVPYARYGLHAAQGAQNRPVLLHELAGWMAAVPGLHERLARPGAHALEFGCGVGWACIALAEAFPQLRVDGVDLDEDSVAQARRFATQRGLGDRVTFTVADVAADDGTETGFDLVLAVEMLHDLSRPVEALAAMRRLATAPGAEDGVVVVVDENVRDVFTAPADELERAFYAFSVLHCLPVGLAEQPSAATGTMLRPDVLRDYARLAGFAEVVPVDVANDFFRAYRLVP